MCLEFLCHICNTYLQKNNNWGHNILRILRKNEKRFPNKLQNRDIELVFVTLVLGC